MSTSVHVRKGKLRHTHIDAHEACFGVQQVDSLTMLTCNSPSLSLPLTPLPLSYSPTSLLPLHYTLHFSSFPFLVILIFSCIFFALITFFYCFLSACPSPLLSFPPPSPLSLSSYFPFLIRHFSFFHLIYFTYSYIFFLDISLPASHSPPFPFFPPFLTRHSPFFQLISFTYSHFFLLVYSSSSLFFLSLSSSLFLSSLSHTKLFIFFHLIDFTSSYFSSCTFFSLSPSVFLSSCPLFFSRVILHFCPSFQLHTLIFLNALIIFLLVPSLTLSFLLTPFLSLLLQLLYSILFILSASHTHFFPSTLS